MCPSTCVSSHRNWPWRLSFESCRLEIPWKRFNTSTLYKSFVDVCTVCLGICRIKCHCGAYIINDLQRSFRTSKKKWTHSCHRWNLREDLMKWTIILFAEALWYGHKPGALALANPSSWTIQLRFWPARIKPNEISTMLKRTPTSSNCGINHVH